MMCFVQAACPSVQPAKRQSVTVGEINMYEQKPWLSKYETGVPETIDYKGQLLHETLDASARKYPSNVAVRFLLKYLPLGIAIQSKLTYRELKDATDRFAAALRNLGMQEGDRMAIMMPNTPQQVIAFYGALKAGVIVVNTNPTYTSRELEHQLKDSGAKTIVMLSGLHKRLEPVPVDIKPKNIIIADVPDALGFPFNRLVERTVRASGTMIDIPDGPGIYRFDNLLKTSPPQPPKINVKPDDVLLFQYTGGTTGTPKAAMLTHKNLVSNVLQMEAWLTNLEYGKEKTLGALPNFHVYGMTVSMLLSIYSGGELIVTPDPRQTQLILEIIHREKISLYPGIPTMYTAIINHPKVQEYDLRSVKACLSGGMALPVQVQQKFEEITGGKLVEGYGLTETSPVAHANPVNGMRKAGCIGFPVSSTEAAIVALDANADGSYNMMPVGQEGEIVVRGPQVMKGYWQKEDETAKVIDKDGWFHTGDIGTMDEEGWFKVVDRKKDLIIASGYNIVPREVEEVIYMHAKVQEVVVAGVPDEHRGETVKAYIILKEGQSCTVDEIRSFCKENLAPYKVPTLVEFRSELPKSQVGKILRRVLVEEEKQKQAEKA
jgi:long-chain acyl-CoA synthetase